MTQNAVKAGALTVVSPSTFRAMFGVQRATFVCL